MSKKLSPFSIEYWMARGMSEEDATYKRNSMRPINKEYWMVRGMSEEDAIDRAILAKETNNKKGALASSKRVRRC